MDWLDKSRLDRFTFEMVDPNDINSSRGFIDGVITSECSIDFGYYTDTRVSATLKAVESNYIENSLIRIRHFVDDAGFSEELGTFFVKSIDGSSDPGSTVDTFSLMSMMTRISDDKFVKNYSIAKNAYAKTLLAQLFKDFGCDCSMLASCGDKRYGDTKVYDYGQGVLSVAFDLCSDIGARMDVDGHGRIVVSPYVAPSSKTATASFTEDNGTVIGHISKSDDLYSTINRYGVVYKDSEKDKQYQGYADVASTSKMSRGRRGRRVTEIETLNELSPASNRGATAQSKIKLAENDDRTVEYGFDSIYFPREMVDIANIEYNGETNKCMLKSRTVKLSPGMPCTNTYKEV